MKKFNSSDLSNALLDNLISNYAHPALLLSKKGIIKKWSTRLIELYSFEKSELAEQDIISLFKLKNLDFPFTSIEDMFAGNSFPVTEVKKDKLYTLQWSVTDIDTEYMFLAAADISNVMNAARQNKYIKESILNHTKQHYIFWKDINSVYQGCNAALAELLGLNDCNDIIGMTDYQLTNNIEQSDAYCQDDRTVIKSGLAKLGIEELFTRTTGEQRFLLTNKVPLFDEKANIHGILGICADITDRKKLELSLAHAELANIARNEFITNISHDIRTPLTGIVGMSKLLEDGPLSPEYKQYAHWINESGEQLVGLLSRILDVVSNENLNDNNTQRQTFNLHKCIKDIGQLELPSAVIKGLELNIYIDPNVPHFISTDQTKLHRILLNLTSNAIKFTDQGSVSIQVEKLHEQNSVATIKISVNDSGIGIADEFKDKVFDRFFRANSSLNTIHPGHGVGLHIAQKYVELLGGELQLTSVIGKGSTFFFTLDVDIAYANFEIRETTANYHIEPEIKLSPINTIKKAANEEYSPQVLLVEDNNLALRLIEVMATQSGLNFVSAINGEQALQLIYKERFDLVITDVGLPGISGYQLTATIRQWEKDNQLEPTPIIGLTAQTMQEAEQKCLESGMNGIVCKPINLTKISQIINQYSLSKHSLRTSLIDSTAPLDAPEFIRILDTDLGISHLGEKHLLIKAVTLMLEKEIPECMAILIEAYPSKNWAAIEKAAHKLKGTAIYCGATKLQFACQQFESYHKSGKSSQLNQFYQQLLCVLGETKAYCQRWLNNPLIQQNN
ncbi:MAG: ATP-binding protein [Legionella sp.]